MPALKMQSFLRDSPALSRLGSMPRAELEALQLAKVQRLVARLWHVNPFYRRKWQAAGVHPDCIRTLDDFSQRIPVCTKQDFLKDQSDVAPFGARLGLGSEPPALVNLTGGTSGQGQEYYGRSQRDVLTQAYMHFLPWFMAGLRRGDVALNCVPSGGMSTGGWGPAEGIRLAGATGFHVGGNLTTQAKIDMMQKLRSVHFIYASTNYIHTLTQAMLQSGIKPAEAFPMMKSIFIAAEGYPLEWAQDLHANWGCPIHEGYGSTQGAGFIATTCDHSVIRPDGNRGQMHLFEWAHRVEVVDPETGRHVLPGEEGEIILTNLDVQASPVVRFSTRDRVRWHQSSHCSCGLPWHTIEAGTIGRYDDMIKVRGNNIWPITFDQIIFANGQVAEYSGRVYVDARDKTEVEILLAFKPGACSSLEARDLIGRIGDRIKERTNVAVLIREVLASDLPEHSYKARRWRDERQQGYRSSVLAN
jgi:phenylacetate-CoA ligase